MPRNEATSTVANADLWAAFFQDEWSRMTGRPARREAQPESASAVAATAAAQVASFLTLVAAGPIAWLYINNAQSV